MNTEASPSAVVTEAEAALRPAYRDLTEDEKALIQQIKSAGVQLHALIGSVPPSRESSLAKTKLEEAVMWVVKGITK